jgi:hypothetical protein
VSFVMNETAGRPPRPATHQDALDAPPYTVAEIAGGALHLRPAARTLEAFERRDGAWVLVAAVKDAEEVRCLPFDAIGFPLLASWAV